MSISSHDDGGIHQRRRVGSGTLFRSRGTIEGSNDGWCSGTGRPADLVALWKCDSFSESIVLPDCDSWQAHRGVSARSRVSSATTRKWPSGRGSIANRSDVNEALRAWVTRRRRRDAVREMEALRTQLPKVGTDEVARWVREDREHGH